MEGKADYHATRRRWNNLVTKINESRNYPMVRSAAADRMRSERCNPLIINGINRCTELLETSDDDPNR